MNYKIGRVYIENFKHIESKLFDFSNQDLIVLDGPNGFGKTTIFDVIEIVLRKKIDRVKNTNDKRFGYGKLLLAKDDSKDTLIKVEFYNDNKRFTIVQKIDSSKKFNPADKKPDNWNIFDTYYLNDFEDELELSDINFLKEDMPQQEINKYFSLFYYIQQEDNISFLKKGSKERMLEISTLFDTKKEEEQKNKVINVKSKLIKIKTDYFRNEEMKKNNVIQLSENINQEKDKNYKKIEHFYLFSEDILKPEWEKEISTIQKETRDSYLIELSRLLDFKQNINEFLKASFNKKIEEFANNKVLLQYTFISLFFIDKFDEFQELITKEKKLKKIKSDLDRENINTTIEKFPYEDLQKEPIITINKIELEEKIRTLLQYKNEMNGLSKIVQEINNTRQSLVNSFNQFKVLEEKESQNCPLCGDEKSSYEELIISIEKQEQKFSSYYDGATSRFNDTLEDLYKKVFNPIIDSINVYLANDNNTIDNAFFAQLQKSKSYKQTILSFDLWCKENNIDLQSNLNKNKFKLSKESIEVAVEEISILIREKRKSIKENYEENTNLFKDFETIYSSLFKNERERIEGISEEEIKLKIDYVNYQYFNNSTKMLEEINNQIAVLKEKQSFLEEKIGELTSIIDIYDKQISIHWRKIIRSIEIPFYIYSGKIMQDYQKGRGIFIKESIRENEKTISFVSGQDSDHDVVNYLSSGQLAALIISLTLALNKIYGNRSMDILLIDDPVQTMDEINVASLIEVLRNDFRDKQIILSTHEEDISRYIRYKFKKYNLAVTQLNMKEEIYS